MTEPWTFDAPDDETGNEVKCEECGQTIAPTEPCFSHKDHLLRWAFVCIECVCVRLGEKSAA